MGSDDEFKRSLYEHGQGHLTKVKKKSSWKFVEEIQCDNYC